jgi:hypothetical protein
VPGSASELRVLFEETGGRILADAGQRVDLPRVEKKTVKKETVRNVWGSCVGTVMALSNVMLAMPTFGLPVTVSMASMAIGAHALGLNTKQIARILPMGVGRTMTEKARSRRASQ